MNLITKTLLILYLSLIPAQSEVNKLVVYTYDSFVAEWGPGPAIETKFEEDHIILRKNKIDLPKSINLNLKDSPDLAQTIIITCLGLGVDCTLDGLHTLKIKETDRLIALKNEIEKFNVDKVEITKNQQTFKETKLLKLNCDKALSLINWKPRLDFTATMRLTNEWYYEFYNQRNFDVLKKCIDQIKKLFC